MLWIQFKISLSRIHLFKCNFIYNRRKNHSYIFDKYFLISLFSWNIVIWLLYIYVIVVMLVKNFSSSCMVCVESLLFFRLLRNCELFMYLEWLYNPIPHTLMTSHTRDWFKDIFFLTAADTRDWFTEQNLLRSGSVPFLFFYISYQYLNCKIFVMDSFNIYNRNQQ